MKSISKSILVLLMTLSATSFSCKKLLEIPESKGQVESGVVFADSTVATAALMGAYYTMVTTHTAMKFASLYADEYTFTSNTPINVEYLTSQLSSLNSTNASLWNSLYSVIYQSNAIQEGLKISTGLSQKTRQQLEAEAKFLRAYANFYLVNFFDHIPLVLTTNVEINKRAPQVAKEIIYKQIIKDLTEAKSELSTSYPGAGRVRANSLAATALLSRVWLYLSEWEKAVGESSIVINSNITGIVNKPEDVFVAGSNEAILQLWVANGFLTDIAQLVPASATILPSYLVTESLYQSFEVADARKTKWLGTNTVNTSGQPYVYRYPAKYKNRIANTTKQEFIMALRLSEQYLIRAEALAQLSQIPQAVDDLNITRIRAGLTQLDKTVTQASCLEAVAKERKLELFGEWGHRLLDLKRTGQLDLVMGSVKPTWKPGKAKAFPIPNNEIIYNSNLIQNNGY